MTAWTLTEPAERLVARVEVNDECRVDVRLGKKTVSFSPEQAHEFGTAILAAGLDAKMTLDQMLRDRAERLLEPTAMDWDGVDR
jgi:hypothetical protein